jgi:hypothetical protein
MSTSAKTLIAALLIAAAGLIFVRIAGPTAPAPGQSPAPSVSVTR